MGMKWVSFAVCIDVFGATEPYMHLDTSNTDTRSQHTRQRSPSCMSVRVCRRVWPPLVHVVRRASNLIHDFNFFLYFQFNWLFRVCLCLYVVPTQLLMCDVKWSLAVFKNVHERSCVCMIRAFVVGRFRILYAMSDDAMFDVILFKPGKSRMMNKWVQHMDLIDLFENDYFIRFFYYLLNFPYESILMIIWSYTYDQRMNIGIFRFVQANLFSLFNSTIYVCTIFNNNKIGK